MALVIKDRVKESSTTTGTGTYTLAGAEAGFQTFAAIGDGNTTYYSATDGTDWEVGIGTYTSSGTTLARTTILSSSNSDSAVNWGAGTKLLFCTQPSSKAVLNDANDKFVNGDHFSGVVTFDALSGHPSHAEGQVYYDSLHKTLSYQSDISDIEHEIGVEEHVRVYNNSGATIARGKPVYWSGNSGDYPTIELANATSEAKYNVQGLTGHDIANNSYGYVIVSGLVDGFDTSSLTAGANFFAGLTDGALQNASPTYPNYPMCLGWVVKSHASEGIVLVNQQNHSVNSFRVRTDAHIGGDMIVTGDLTVQGTQTSTSSNNVELGASFQYLNAGDTIGDLNTGFTGSGLDDATLTGHYTGTASNKIFYVRIDGTGTPDTFEWSTDNFSTTEATDVAITGSDQSLADGISINFGSTTGHTSGDVWTGTANPANVDTGFFTNYNTGSSGIGYTHTGLFWDASTLKWTFLSAYDPEPEGTINLSHSSTTYATLKLGTVEADLTGDVNGNVTGDVTGNLTGNVTGNVSGNLTGDVTGGVTGNLTGNVTGNVTGDVTGDLTGSVTDSSTSSFGTVQLGDWTITEDVNGKLAFSHNGTVKATLSDDGTFAAANDIFTDETL